MQEECCCTHACNLVQNCCCLLLSMQHVFIACNSWCKLTVTGGRLVLQQTAQLHADVEGPRNTLAFAAECQTYQVLLSCFLISSRVPAAAAAFFASFSCRHQADVFHAYQVLINGGYSPDHIVVMAYDDVAHNPENPMPGKVFNAPGAVMHALVRPL